MDFVCCVCDKIVSLFNLIWSFLTNNDMKVIELGLTAWGCSIALRGLNTWRQQVIEQPKIELAKEIVEQFYNMKDLISRARCPFISYSPEEVRKFYEMSDLTDYQAGLAYRLMILDKSFDQIQAFQKLRNKAKVVYSKEIENCFFEINKILNLFKQACKSMMEETSTKSLAEMYGKKMQKEFSERVYEKEENDATNIKIREVIEEVEYNLKPIYKAKSIEWKKLKSETKDKTNDQ